MLRFLISLFLLTGVLTTLCGQVKDGTLINYSQENGLPSDEAYCVYKDSKGYIWIATDQGVVRHKGGAMEVIKGLPDNVIFKIREDRKGRVWFFSRSNQLSYYSEGKVYPFLYNNLVAEKIKRHLVGDVLIAPDGNIYYSNVGDFGDVVINSNNGGLKKQPYTEKEKSEVNTFNVICLNDSLVWPYRTTFTENYNLIVINVINRNDTISYRIPCRPQTISRFSGCCRVKGGNILFFVGNSLIKLSGNGKYSLMEFGDEIISMHYNEKNENIYIGLRSKGVQKFAVNDLKRVVNKNLNVLADKSVSSVAFDDEGGEWYSTLEHGVYYQRSNRLTKLTDGNIFRLHYYKDSLLLFGTPSGLYGKNGDEVLHLLPMKTEDIKDIREDKKGRIFLATSLIKGETYFFKTYDRFRISLPGNRATDLFRFFTGGEIFDKDSTKLFFGLGRHLFNFIPDEERIEILSEEAKYMAPEKGKFYQDNNGRLWFCGLTGLYKEEGISGYFNKISDHSGLLAKGITCMRQMDNGIYAACLVSSGLVLIRRDSVIANITEKDGLLSNAVRSVLVSGNRLWLAMPNGISLVEFTSYDPIQYKLTNFGNDVGIGNFVIRQLVEHKGSIAIATNSGVYQLDGIKSPQEQTSLPIPLYITKVSYYKGDTSGINNIVLPYKYNQITVDFDAICYNSFSELEYDYRLLNGPDTSWHSLKTTQIVLGNLIPGNYTLQIKAELPKYGRQSAVQELDITIEKPWWQWNAVRIGALLLFLLIVYYIYNRRVRAITRREKEKTAIQTEMAELKQVALRSQMNPHFIFNCLASIQQLVVAGSRDEANEYLVKFSRLIRKTLELSIRSHISLAEEKEYISEYLELEQLRIPGQFEFNFSIDKDINTDRTEIPNMMLQPIVENCVRHGIKHLEDRKGIIDIRVSRFDGYLRCEVTDNGVGRKEKSPGSIYAGTKSFGLGIVEKRLTGLAGYDHGNYFIKVIDNINKDGTASGTKVILQLPLKIRDI